MPNSHVLFRFRKAALRCRTLQVLLLIAFWGLGDVLAARWGLPVPGGIIGMLMVLGLLLTRRIRLRSMRRGAEWFLAEMMLFFVPAMLAIFVQQGFVGWTGVRILLILLVCTLCIGGITALTVEVSHRWRLAHDLRRDTRD